jgi:hypothetical protein
VFVAGQKNIVKNKMLKFEPVMIVCAGNKGSSTLTCPEGGGARRVTPLKIEIFFLLQIIISG